jgi:methionyl-tRNA formyltransferase
MVEIVFLGINDLGERVYDFLVDRDDADVLALLTERDQLSIVKQLDPDLLISKGFRHVVPDDVLDIPERGAVNLHNSYLPYNRGANANVWPIIEGSPAGVTVHYMTAEVDAGPVIDRREVPVYSDDDARDVYERQENAQFKQFTDLWPSIRDDDVSTVDVDYGKGEYHYKQDFVDLWELDPEAERPVSEVIDHLRALTFPPYKNAFFLRDGERYYIEVSVTHEDDVSGHVDSKGDPEEYHELVNR